MLTRSLLFWVVMVAAGVGVWVGVTTAGTEATPWIKRAIAAGLIVAGASIFLSRDPLDQRIPRLHGAGFVILGVTHLIGSSWSLPALLGALTLMVAGVVQRRRRLADARPA